MGKKALAQRSLNDRHCCTEPREHSAIIAASRVPYTENSRHAHREGAMTWGWVGLSIVPQEKTEVLQQVHACLQPRTPPRKLVRGKRHTPRLFQRAFRRTWGPVKDDATKVAAVNCSTSAKASSYPSHGQQLNNPAFLAASTLPSLGASFGRRRESPSQGKTPPKFSPSSTT